MDSDKVPTEYMTAGGDYLAALKNLGMFPEYAGWGLDVALAEWRLVLVTSIVEVGGPLALNKLLFKAYNMKATPQEISPFIVHVFGDRTLYAEALREWSNLKPGIIKDLKTRNPVTGKIEAEFEGYFTKTIGGLKISSLNMYELPKRKHSHEQRTREWLRFKRNVERLAA